LSLLGGSLDRHALALTDEQKLVVEAWRVVDNGYVDRTFNHQDWLAVRKKAVKRNYSSRDEAYQVIRDMLRSLDDPYTRFLNPVQFESLSSSATGEVTGVGFELFPSRVENAIRVKRTISPSPAEEAGLKAGDIITEVDGEDISALSPDEVAARVRGALGTKVSLTFQHSTDSKEISAVLTRRDLHINTVQARLLGPGLGYFRITAFNQSTPDNLKAALDDLRRPSRVILDLRDNPGGYFSAGVDIARLFLREGANIVSVFDRRGKVADYNATSEAMFPSQPMVILLNGSTASASEILAGALHDNHRAVLVGEKTFGKGVVQTLVPLDDGSGVAVTTARYELPSHISINRVGIQPDVHVKCTGESTVESCVTPDVWILAVKQIAL